MKHLFTKTPEMSKKRYNLLVLRISKTGVLSAAKPCFHCLDQLRKSGILIDKVFYSDPPGVIQMEQFGNFAEAVENKTYTYISTGYKHRTETVYNIKTKQKICVEKKVIHYFR